jgi:acetyl-CoA carboxylase biotin carboxyl carrier protein
MAMPKKKSPTPAPASRPRPAAAAVPPAPHQLAIGFDDLKALIGLVAKEAIDDFEFQSGDVRFHIRKGALVSASPAPAVPATLPPMPSAPAHTLVASAQPAPEAAEDPSIHHITSPIVGTFYRSPTAAGAPYVQPGEYVKPGQTLCIVEAMKLMNEIECDVAGELLAVLVENGQPVEYGERLFSVRIR